MLSFTSRLWLGLSLLCCQLLCAVQAGQASGSLQWSADRQVLYSANLWQGSISRTPRLANNQPGKVEELVLGEDIRRLALGGNDQLLATDYLGDQLILVDRRHWTLISRIPVGKRPFGVVYQGAMKRYFVTLFEANQLLVIENGEITQSLATAATPRGLALTGDNRLLVTHAMTGEVSIYDVAATTPTLLKTIKLAVNQDHDEFKSQGEPRLLDDIAVSPDGKEAWLPHVLWNFDHEFQFQSTVFPAVSVLDLTPGAEQERVQQRKQLFKTINISDSRNRTRIVSNPQDAEFSATGKKVYVTLAGSDDLLVFDRSRVGKRNKKRHRRKKHQGGAKATQIFRHTPGRNPRGLVIDGDQLWLQNAVDQTLTLMHRGGDHAFDRVKLTTAQWAELSQVAETPLQRGRALFHSARTDANPEHPIAGDFWMSCNSCHLDGFNFTNRFMVESHVKAKTKDARTGHPGLGNMVSGDITADLVKIIQKTQGGLGEDDRDGALPVDAKQPPAAVKTAMADLHAMIRQPHNLPFTATWLRLDGQAKTHPKEWLNSAQCAECHQEMFDQWADSNHRLMGESNPYFKVMVELAGQVEGEAFKDWCLGCHVPSSMMSGIRRLGANGHKFEQGGASLFEALEKGESDIDEGTSCLFCHRITEIEDAGGNAAFTVNLKDRQAYIGENHTGTGPGQWLAHRQINAKPEEHKISYSQPFYKDSQLCKTCHNEFAPGSGSLIVDTYGEWQNSSYNNPDDPARHRSCIDCHMHGDIARIGEDIPGRSTQRGPMKKNVVTHQFTGANHHLVGMRNKTLEEMSLQLMRSAASLEQRLSGHNELTVRVNNIGAGHALPTGVADFRQLWLQVTVTDAGGRQVLSTGEVDDKGAVVRDPRLFMKVFGDQSGKPVELLFWRYEKLLSDTRIPADGFRDEVYLLPADTQYPITVTSRLMYRIYPQWVTDIVRKAEPDMPNPPVVELHRLEQEFKG